jgi:hypothetical protein
MVVLVILKPEERGSQHIRRDDHELLEGKTATSVGATVEDVHEGNGEDVGLLGSGKVGNVSVQRNALRRNVSYKSSKAWKACV